MSKISEIINAWAISLNPTEEQKQKAESRYNICNECDSKSISIGIEICSECGCYLKRKVFTQNPNGCPLKKW